jgi:hypothetical protein
MSDAAFIDTKQARKSTRVEQRRVKIRRDRWPWQDFPDDVDGRVFWFRAVFTFCEDDHYGGEQAWAPCDTRWPHGKPGVTPFLAEGDLQQVREKSNA